MARGLSRASQVAHMARGGTRGHTRSSGGGGCSSGGARRARSRGGKTGEGALPLPRAPARVYWNVFLLLCVVCAPLLLAVPGWFASRGRPPGGWVFIRAARRLLASFPSLLPGPSLPAVSHLNATPPGGVTTRPPPPPAISSQPRAPRLRACSCMRNTTHSSGMSGRGAQPPGEQKPGSSVAPPPYSGRARSLDGSPYPCASRRPATRPSGTRPRLGS